MGGVSVTLDLARIGLWSTPSVQITIPRLTLGSSTGSITRTYAGTTAQFVGDTYPTGFRGQSKGRSYALNARYMKGEQDQALALLALFDAAHVATDSRLLLRTHYGQVPGLDGSEAVQVFVTNPTPGLGLYWDIAFTATVVQSTEAV